MSTTTITATVTPSTITLANDTKTTREALAGYFDTILQAEKTGEEFCVSLDHVWRIGYATKEGAVKALKKNFLEGADYQALVQLSKLENGESRSHRYLLTTSCLEYFAVRANRDVFEVYRQCRRAIQQAVTVPALPDFTNPVIAARAWADAEEQKLQLQQQLHQEMQKKEQARVENQRLLQVASQAEEQLHQAEQVIVAQAPAVELLSMLTTSQDTLTLLEAAKILDVENVGRTKLIDFLKNKKVLMKSDGLPYSTYAKYFTVKVSTFENSDGRVRTNKQVLVRTAEGMAFLRRILARAGYTVK